MNAKTLEAVRRHGLALLAAFPNATEKDPVALCKKLRRIETAVSKPILQACNGPELTEGELDAACHKACFRIQDLLGIDRGGVIYKQTGLFINRDPRGYACKLGSDWTQDFNQKQRNAGQPCIAQDWGHYGLLAPALTPSN